MELEDPNEFDDVRLNSQSTTQDKFESHLNHGLDEEKQNIPWLAVFVAFLGLFITLKSIYDYIQVKKIGKEIPQPKSKSSISHLLHYDKKRYVTFLSDRLVNRLITSRKH